MTSGPKILAFAGSARKDSFNKKLVNIAAQGALGAGAQVTELDLATFRSRCPIRTSKPRRVFRRA